MAMTAVQKITPCLWFDNQAEDAAKFYVSIFENSSIGAVTRYGSQGFEVHGRPAGSAMTVSFRLAGQEFTALNGGPHFKFTEAISFVVRCETQAEVDRYWDKLTEGGDERAQRCGWLKDKFGVSWQIVPVDMFEMLSGADREKSGRAMHAMLQMTKLDLPALRRAYEGNS
jgi:predicted 3-demethylubiquinone-9 3-methyltransferase (glyoxalase superfamily)